MHLNGLWFFPDLVKACKHRLHFSRNPILELSPPLADRNSFMEKATGFEQSRRDFTKKLLGGVGAGLTGALLPANASAQTSQAAEPIEKATRDQLVATVETPILVDESQHKRFHSQNIAFNVMARETGVPWYIAYETNKHKFNAEGLLCKDIPAPSPLEIRAGNALDNIAGTFNRWTGAHGEGKENKGDYLSWNPVRVDKALYENPAPVDKPAFTRYVKSVARIAGADLVGVAPLNRRWIYEGTQRNVYSTDAPVTKPIVFKDQRFPEETDAELIIPESVNNVVVIAVEMSRMLVQASPAPIASSADGFGYGRQGVASFLIAEFIRSLGYVAIPCKNDTGLSVPMAIEAGLGEGGRNGVLITPEYGPCVRIGKVLTNMPLDHDKPIRFGVEEFCNSCMKCARECPSKCITEGEQSWEARNDCNNGGVKKWYNDYKKCLQFWMDNGASCSNCIAVCTYTKGHMWGHAVTETVIDKAPMFNGLWLSLDDAFGYGERRLEQDVWQHDFSCYGIDAKKR